MQSVFDLRGPLNFIQLAAKHLEDRLQRTDMHLEGDLVSRMERNAERMSVMIQDLSDSARLETGELTLEREALDLGAIVADMTFGVGRTGDQDRRRRCAEGARPRGR